MATQARAGIGVCGDFICGVFTPNVIVMIAGVDRTSKVVRSEPLSVTLNRNEEHDSAEFTIERNPGFTPTVGQEVTVCLGDSTNPEFGGQIISIEHTRSNKTQYPRYVCRCTDYSQLFNRRRITADFSGQSGTAIATVIVTNYTTGFFTYAIKASMATVAEFICINETPKSALVRLANLLGGGCVVPDARKIVHLWDSGGPNSYWSPSNPATLVDNLATLQPGFTPEYDFGQVRTRVIVEGAGSPLPIEIPVGADLVTRGVPLTDEAATHFSTIASTPDTYARLGTLIVSYDHCELFLGPPSGVLYAAAVPGATSVQITAGASNQLGAFGAWLYDGGRNYFYVGNPVAPGAPYDSYGGIPASGYGAITVELAAGTPLYQAHHLDTVTPLTASGTVEKAVKKDVSVTVRVQHDGAAAQTAIAAIEGGDGIHEHPVADPDLTYTGCSQRADAELAAFAAAIDRASWPTNDMQAKPGTQQVLNLAAPDVITGTLTIDSVTITFPFELAAAALLTQTCPSAAFPLRTCNGSTVKLETILDRIKG